MVGLAVLLSDAPIIADRHREPADLADRLLAVREQLGVLVDQPVRAVVPAGLLVRGEHQHDRPPRPCSGPLTGTDDRQHHRVEVLHVDRAAAPDAAVLDLAGERVDGPVRGLRGHDVEVAVDEQRLGGRVGALPAGGERRTAGRRLVQLRRDADVGQLRGDVLRRLPLARPGTVAVVGGVDPDQIAAQLHDLGLWPVLHPLAHVAILSRSARTVNAEPPGRPISYRLLQ
jgi:hypothetical protein